MPYYPYYYLQVINHGSDCFCMQRCHRFAMRANHGESGHKDDAAIMGETAILMQPQSCKALFKIIKNYRRMSKGLVTSF